MPGRTSNDIRKVALAGKGYVGEKVYNELVHAGYDVTVLSRSNPGNEEKVKIVNYDSTESLTEALRGQDAVVSTLNPAGWPHQYRLIDAAVSVGSIQHFIPSDFTALSTNPAVAQLPFYKDAMAIQDYLKKRADESGMKWTIVATGPLLGCVLNGDYMYNYQTQTALHVGNAEHRVSMTRRPTLAKAIAGIFARSKEMESGPIFIQDYTPTQNEMLEIAERLCGKKWSVQHADADKKLQEGLAMIKKAKIERTSPPIFATFLVIHSTIFGGKYNTAWDREGNMFLGLPFMSAEEFEGLIAQRVRNEPIDGGLPWNSAPKPRNVP
ncbi:bifunctional pinoresinol-lariciresinol reductase [Colletotrichum spaethianum]|uniref:Bifunctional pinoresinol-lariciresinol reductase n=1 Tax=Colletotrichum spaethianum TaxID=700344 RepID=A0AA37P868_9PEZI|nr:bifunctional pinoresinol-lariciresinol reductase [Colletotrichum spaethianum]GKT47436.1 bifunctional pinoresinol-lariciresinol reductase [Colletotrichum spaethianum]